MASVLAPAWGVKEAVEPSKADEIKQYMQSVANSNFTISSGETVVVLKGDVKEKNGEATLIFRYQIVK